MVLSVPISQEVEAKLAAKGRAAGVDLSSYVATLLEQATRRPLSLHEIAGSAAGDFAKSGMTDDELGDFLEEVKHDELDRRQGRVERYGQQGRVTGHDFLCASGRRSLAQATRRARSGKI